MKVVDNRERFLKHRPRLVHVSLAKNLDQVRQLGLLSTEALLDRFEVAAAQRKRLEFEPRTARVQLSHPVHGDVFLNDQSPLSESALRKCLIEMTPAEWCASLNMRVFFWPTQNELPSIYSSQLGRTYQRTVLVADTEAVLDAYQDDIEVAFINTGNTRRKPAPRGRDTFRKLHQYFADPEFSVSRIVELTLPYEMRRTDLLQLYKAV